MDRTYGSTPSAGRRRRATGYAGSPGCVCARERTPTRSLWRRPRRRCDLAVSRKPSGTSERRMPASTACALTELRPQHVLVGEILRPLVFAQNPLHLLIELLHEGVVLALDRAVFVHRLASHFLCD